MEHKTFPAFTTKIEDDLGIVDAIVAVMGNVDEGDDVIHPGAFTKTIMERGTKIRVLDQHRTDSIMSVLGKPMEIREVRREELPIEVLARFPEASGGLKTRTQYLMNTPEGKGAFIRIKSGAVDEYSIGYDTVPKGIDFSKSEDGRTIRNLRELKLYEYSPVLWAMNQATATLSAKEQPTEKKPWDVFMDGDQHCVYKVDENGERTGESLGCHATAEEARQQVEALYVNEGKADDKQVTRSEADGQHPASHYLVVEDPEKPSTWHLRVRDVNGDPDHRLMGAAWAALHGGYRGNVYEGPGKQEAIRKLRAMYAAEEMDTPKDDGKAGRRVRADKVELLRQIESAVAALKDWAEYLDEEDAAKEADNKPEENKAGPGTAPLTSQDAEPEVTPPTSEELLRLLEMQEHELSLMR